MKIWHLLLTLLLLNCNLNLYATTNCEAPAPAFAQVTSVGNDHATVSWSPVANAQSYLVSTSLNSSGFMIASDIVSGTTYTIDNLTSGEEYSISIQASFCDYGPFGPPQELSFQTEIIVVDVILQSGCLDQANGVEGQFTAGDITSFRLEQPGCYLMNVVSLSSNPEFEYNLAFASLGGSTTLIGNFESNPADFVLVGNGPVNGFLVNSGDLIPLLSMHSIQTQVGGANMNIHWEQDVDMTLSRCSSCSFTYGGGTRSLISNATFGTASDMKFELYPNPVQDQLNVLLPTPSPVEVWDLVGRRWATLGQVQPNRSYRVEVSDWPTGTYLLRWLDPNGVPQVNYFLRHGQ